MSTGVGTGPEGARHPLWLKVRGPFAALGRAWLKVRLFFGVLNLIRFSLLLALVGILMVLVAQGQEILIAMADARLTPAEVVRKAGFVLAAVLCALSAWYTARIMYLFRFDAPASEASVFPGLKAHLPRVLGALIMVLVAAALVGAAWPNVWLALVLLAATGFFVFFVYFRRKWFGLNRLADASKNLTSVTQLPRTARIILLAILGLNVVFMVAFAYGYDWLGPALGAATVVLFAMALMIPVGTALVYFGNRFNVPIISLLLLLAVVFSLFNDNHRVRQTAGMRPYEPVAQAVARMPVTRALQRRSLQPYQDLEGYFTAWLRDLRPLHPGHPIPVVLVAAEGGGIRAAFWTASVLAELQDQAGAGGLDFGRHVFAISGVSGGSLGAAVFAALLKTPYREDTAAEDAPCGARPHASYRCRAQRILARDFLAPTVAVLLFPDLLQRFLPVAVFDDRAVALERSWEQAWQRYEPGDRFANAFEDLWREDPFGAPLLFLNSTVVETGQRIIVDPVGFDSDSFRHTFHDAYNAASVIGAQVPLSTAVHMSARFTYVSPAGTIERQDPERTPDELAWYRVVDGGYFENSGAVTLDEILLALRREAMKTGVQIQPVVIHISNDPIKKPKQAVAESPGKHVFMGEVLSPVRALLNVRPARGYQARDVLAERVVTPEDDEPGEHVHFRLCAYDVTLPLGWMLSGLAQDDMTHQLVGYPDRPPGPGPAANTHNLDRVLALLAGSADPGPREVQCW